MDPKVSKQCSSCLKTGEDVLSCVCKTVHYCSKQCQRDDWKIHKKNCPPFVIGDAGDKGRGMFATRNISQASVILIEEPILTLETEINGNVNLMKLFNKFMKLPESQRLEISKLHDKTEEDSSVNVENFLGAFNTSMVALDSTGFLKKFLCVYKTNMVARGDPGKSWEIVLYLKNSYPEW